MLTKEVSVNDSFGVIVLPGPQGGSAHRGELGVKTKRGASKEEGQVLLDPGFQRTQVRGSAGGGKCVVGNETEGGHLRARGDHCEDRKGTGCLGLLVVTERTVVVSLCKGE